MLAVRILGFRLDDCLDLAQLDRPHGRQYIAVHKKGKPYFALHYDAADRAPKCGIYR
jgi:hypothetical protein